MLCLDPLIRLLSVEASSVVYAEVMVEGVLLFLPSVPFSSWELRRPSMGISRILRSFPYGAYMFYSRYRMPGPSSALPKSHNHLPLPEHSYANRAVECSIFLCTDLPEVGEWGHQL